MPGRSERVWLLIGFDVDPNFPSVEDHGEQDM